jgi:hypothetical protein
LLELAVGHGDVVAQLLPAAQIAAQALGAQLCISGRVEQALRDCPFFCV